MSIWTDKKRTINKGPIHYENNPRKSFAVGLRSLPRPAVPRLQRALRQGCSHCSRPCGEDVIWSPEIWYKATVCQLSVRNTGTPIIRRGTPGPTCDHSGGLDYNLWQNIYFFITPGRKGEGERSVYVQKWCVTLPGKCAYLGETW